MISPERVHKLATDPARKGQVQALARAITRVRQEYGPRSNQLAEALEKLSSLDTEMKSFECESPASEFNGFKTRCRKCNPCLRHRQWTWTKRAKTEYGKHERAWFITLTYNRKHVAQAKWAHMTAWMNRLRKAHPESAYMAVQEFGEKSGRYHFHVMFMCKHEVTKRRIEYTTGTKRRWPYGNVQVKLVRQDLKGETYEKWHTQKKHVMRRKIRDAKRYGSRKPVDSKPLGKYLAKYFGKFEIEGENATYTLRPGRMSASRQFGKDNEQGTRNYFKDRLKYQAGERDRKGNIKREFIQCAVLNPRAIHGIKGTRAHRIRYLQQRVERYSKLLLPNNYNIERLMLAKVKTMRIGPPPTPDKLAWATKPIRTTYQFAYPDLQRQLQRILPYWQQVCLNDETHTEPLLIDAIPEWRKRAKYERGECHPVKFTMLTSNLQHQHYW